MDIIDFIIIIIVIMKHKWEFMPKKELGIAFIIKMEAVKFKVVCLVIKFKVIY